MGSPVRYWALAVAAMCGAWETVHLLAAYMTSTGEVTWGFLAPTLTAAAISFLFTTVALVVSWSKGRRWSVLAYAMDLGPALLLLWTAQIQANRRAEYSSTAAPRPAPRVEQDAGRWPGPDGGATARPAKADALYETTLVNGKVYKPHRAFSRRAGRPRGQSWSGPQRDLIINFCHASRVARHHVQMQAQIPGREVLLSDPIEVNLGCGLLNCTTSEPPTPTTSLAWLLALGLIWRRTRLA